MSSLAFQDTLVGSSPGFLAGRVSTSGHTWSNSSSISDDDQPLSIDSTPSLYCASADAHAFIGVSGWTPPSANYGVAIIGDFEDATSATNTEFGVLAYWAVVSDNSFNYQLTGYGVQGWIFQKTNSGSITTLAGPVAHTFTAGEKHCLYILVESNSGSPIVSAYIDGTFLISATDSSSPLSATGTVAARLATGGTESTSTTGPHIFNIQTDPQAGTLTVPSLVAGTISSNFTITMEVPAILGTTATLSDGGAGGTFSPTSLTFANGTGGTVGQQSATFTYKPSIVGTINFTVAVTTPATTFNATGSGTATAPPSGVTLTGPTTGTLYQQTAKFTVSQAANFTGTVTLSDGQTGSNAGIFTPKFLSWNGTSQSQTFTYTPNKSGSISISATTSSGAVSGSPISLTVAVNPTTSVIITGPTPAGNGLIAAVQGTATGNFTVTPNGLLTDKIILKDGRNGGTFTPSSLTFTNSATPQTFTYTPAVTSTIDITFVSLAGVIQYPQRFTIDSGPPAATTLTLTGPTTANAGFGTPVPFTVTPNGTYTGVVTPSDSSTGTFTPAKLIWLNGSNAPQTFIYQPANTESGSKNVSITASPSLTLVGSPIAVTVAAARPFTNFGVGVYNSFYYPNPQNN